MRTPSSSESSQDRAQQVCTSCKLRKRKCNKALPKCSSCARRNLTCKYLTGEQARNATARPERPWPGFPLDDDQPDVQSIDYPTVVFLDPSILQNGHVEIPRTAAPVPAYILNLLGDINEIRATATKYFEHIHSWMPFVSKKRFYELYFRPSFQSRPDIALLLLSLKLITTLPPTSPRNPQTSLYQTAKHFYLEVEGSSLLSVPILQAGVLLAFYELGHGIYPAAFLSIGACARYAHALGINVCGALNVRKVLTMVEVEERRRVWWAIVILDRFVSIGCPGRPFATADPTLDDLLPTDDAAWDQGIVRADDSSTLSSPMSGHMSKFALLCQAARLLGQVLHHISSNSAMHDNVWVQLDRTLESMIRASLNVDSPDFDQIAFAYSALVALHRPWLYSTAGDTSDTERTHRARVVIEQIIERINANLVERQCFMDRSPEDMSPWGLFFAYHVCVVHARYNPETPDSCAVVNGLKQTLSTIDIRWNVAGVYLQLLEAQEAINKV